MGREYKIRMPVMERLCGNCGLDYKTHLDGKCLFDFSDFKPGKVKTERKMVKARISVTAYCCGRTQQNTCAKCGRDFRPCGRCGDTKKDPEHEGACGECQ